MTRAPSTCTVCGVVIDRGSRCPTHQAPDRTNPERDRRTRTVAQHRATYGDWCPGWNRPGHPASDLTADHLTPRAHGGETGPLQVLCRSCNATRGATPLT